MKNEPVFYVRVKPPDPVVPKAGGAGVIVNPLARARSELAAVRAKLTKNADGFYVKPDSMTATSFHEKIAKENELLDRIKQLQNIDKAIKDAAKDVGTYVLGQTEEQLNAKKAKVEALKDDKVKLGIPNVAPKPPPPPPPPIPERDVSAAVLTFEFEEDEKKVDILKLTLENSDLRWFDDPIFEKGTILVVSWGYVGRMSPPREVVVQKISGALTLTIEAHAKDVLMNKTHRTRTFKDVTRAEVVQQIADENGYGPESQDIDFSTTGPPDPIPMPFTPAGAALAHARENLAKAFANRKRALAPGSFASDSFIDDLSRVIRRLELEIPDLEHKAAVASAIALKAMGAPPEPPPEVTRYATIVQAGQTDAQFVKKLADLQGFEFYVDFDGFHWHPRRFAQKPVVEWTYFIPPKVGDIVTFSLENDVTAKPGEVKIAHRDPLTKTDTVITANTAETPRPVLAPEPELFAAIDAQTGEVGPAVIKPGTSPKPPGTTSTVVQPTTEKTVAGAKVEAAGVFKRTQQATVQLTLDLIGNPFIVSKTVVMVAGLGTRLSGRYYIGSLTHKIAPGSGYTMQAKCKTDGTNKTPATSTSTVTGDKSAAQPNTKPPPELADQGKLTPKEVIDPVTGETKTIYIDTKGRDPAAG